MSRCCGVVTVHIELKKTVGIGSDAMRRYQNLLAINDPLRRKYQVQVGRTRAQSSKQPQSRHFARRHLYTRGHKLDNGAGFGRNGKRKAYVERRRQVLVTEFLKSVSRP